MDVVVAIGPEDVQAVVAGGGKSTNWTDGAVAGYSGFGRRFAGAFGHAQTRIDEHDDPRRRYDVFFVAPLRLKPKWKWIK